MTPAASKSKSKSRKKSKTKTGEKGASKKAKANSAAKTDGASAAPQQGSGESSTTAVLSSLLFVSLGVNLSEIRREPSWPSTFPLLSAVEAVTKAGFKPELALLWKLLLVADFLMLWTVIGLLQMMLGCFKFRRGVIKLLFFLKPLFRRAV